LKKFEFDPVSLGTLIAMVAGMVTWMYLTFQTIEQTNRDSEQSRLAFIEIRLQIDSDNIRAWEEKIRDGNTLQGWENTMYDDAKFRVTSYKQARESIMGIGPE